jgi:hypothetical protein
MLDEQGSVKYRVDVYPVINLDFKLPVADSM